MLSLEYISTLKSTLGPTGWSDDAATLAPYLTDWRGRYTGKTAFMLKPRTTAEVAACVRLANQHHVSLVPQGGNTGLVGGATPDMSGDQVLISLSRMNAIRSVSISDDSMVVEAGVVLAHVQKAASDANRYFPMSLASEGSAQIGGLVATNAGGVHVLRYGSMRALVLGVEAVLADGSIFHGLSSLRKDNSGYDFKQLLIGSEGTLGIITSATLKLFPKPQTYATAFVGLENPHAALELLNQLQASCDNMLCAFELMPRAAIGLVGKHMPDCRDPLANHHSWYVLVEAASTLAETHLQTALSSALESGLIRDAAFATSESHRTAFWKIRESVPEAERLESAAIKHDISVPTAAMPAFMLKATQVLEATYPGTRVLAFGHLGDGNVHFNLLQPSHTDTAKFLALTSEVNQRVYDLVLEQGGSISAEHGIGRLKKAELARTADPAKLMALKAIKKALDPENILNPGVMLDL